MQRAVPSLFISVSQISKLTVCSAHSRDLIGRVRQDLAYGTEGKGKGKGKWEGKSSLDDPHPPCNDAVRDPPSL